MVSVHVSSAVDRGFEPNQRLKKNGTCCLSAQHAALRRKNNDWLARNQNNVSRGGFRGGGAHPARAP